MYYKCYGQIYKYYIKEINIYNILIWYIFDISDPRIQYSVIFITNLENYVDFSADLFSIFNQESLTFAQFGVME